MLHAHQETPDTRLERQVITAVWILILLGVAYLVRRIDAGPDTPHGAEFIGLALLLALAAYLGLTFHHLVTVRYAISGGQLTLQQGRRQETVDLTAGIQLHRWRSRWGWSGGAARDLGTEEIDHYPSLPLFQSGIWVVAGTTTAGVWRAVALRPSPRLLALLREHAAVQRETGD